MKQTTQFSCKECGESFAALANLKTHETSHAEQTAHHDEMYKKTSGNSFAVSAILAILTLITIAQTVQAQLVISKLSSDKYSDAPAQNQTNTPLPSSLQNLPNMVGGC
jgi:hypothetical protein